MCIRCIRCGAPPGLYLVVLEYGGAAPTAQHPDKSLPRPGEGGRLVPGGSSRIGALYRSPNLPYSNEIGKEIGIPSFEKYVGGKYKKR
jgi:hypothetical protein